MTARNLGQSTIACALDGFVMRFRDQNARSHLFSWRENTAWELLEAVKLVPERLLGSGRRAPIRREAAAERGHAVLVDRLGHEPR